MIKNHLQRYFEEVKRFTKGVSESIARDYDNTLEDFFFNYLCIRPEVDYPYYNIDGKKYNAMIIIKNSKWIHEHIKVDSTLPPQLRMLAKPADDIVIEFWCYGKNSKGHKEYIELREKKENNINSNSKYIYADFADILGNDVNEFRKNLEKLFKKAGIIINSDTIDEEAEINENETEIENIIDEEMDNGLEENINQDIDDENTLESDELEEGNGGLFEISEEPMNDISNDDILYDIHLFNKDTGLHKWTSEKYNLLGYDKSGKDENGMHITDF